MDKLKWSEKYSVNVRDCDEQHKTLFSLLNNMISLKEKGYKRREMFNVLSEMVEYSYSHFNTEVNYMIESDYPDFLSHNKEHQYYMKKVNDFLNEFEEDSETLFTDIIKFLKFWWIEHILKKDKKYAPYFNKKGLK